jgi:hypothetical protein
MDTDLDNLKSHVPFKHRKFKLPAKGRGPVGPTNLEAMVLCNEQDVNARPNTGPPLKFNLTLGERRALKGLIGNHQIVIFPADKGAATVVMDRIEYLTEGYRQLSDLNYYKELDTDPTEQYRIEVQNAVEDLYQNGEIDETVKHFLTDSTSKTSRFYLLPKIHKGILPPPGRPVVASNGSPMQKISIFVDHFLNPTVQKIKSYVKDTTHFLKLLNDVGPLPDKRILATLDITSMYTNIPKQQGMLAAEEALNKFRRGPGLKPSNKSLMEHLDLVLSLDNFTFNGSHFLQVKGTAIGTMAAPSFVCNYGG